jgi:hypothetical protein
LSVSDLNFFRGILNIVFYGIEYLNYKKEKDLPKELIFCLNQVLKDWIPDALDEYFIVISYNQTLEDFYYKALSQELLRNVKLKLSILLGVEYEHSLIQISKPRFLFNDFLGSVPVYHELGHFVDYNYQITKNLFGEKTFLTQIPENEKERHNEIFYREYFADLFAAQYISKSGIERLSYIGHGAKDSSTHPSTQRRIKIIESFILGSGDVESTFIIENLKKATRERTNGTELKIRNAPLSPNPFLLLSPVSLGDGNFSMIHSLFSEGWKQWVDRDAEIHEKYEDPIACSKAINNLIKESIQLTMRT